VSLKGWFSRGVAIDGTKIEADVAEDLEFGDLRGDELPERRADRRDRRARLREALRQLDADGPSDVESYQAARKAREAESGHNLGGRRANPNSKWASPARTRKINLTDPDSRTLKDGRRFIWGYNAPAAVTADQIVIAAEVTNAARDSVVFAPMVAAAEGNLADSGADPPQMIVADTGYSSVPNATLDIDAEVLITPMPITQSITDPDDPRLGRRRAVIERLDRGDITVRSAAAELGVATTTVRKLLKHHRRGLPDSAQVRQAMVERLGTDAGTAAYATRKTTVETVFGNIKANLRFRRFSLRGLTATTSEWRLVCAAHNLLRIQRHRLATT